MQSRFEARIVDVSGSISRRNRSTVGELSHVGVPNRGRTAIFAGAAKENVVANARFGPLGVSV
jgi:hypothetical protein